MLTTKRTKTLSGNSIIEIDGQRKVVATMSAAIGENGEFSKTENVIDIGLYELHKAEVQSDMKEFSDKAYEMSAEVDAE